MKVKDTVEALLESGYSEIPIASGTGSRVLVNADAQRVIKINQDNAYAKFADFCLYNQGYSVPRVYSHTYPLGPFLRQSNVPYSVAEMELLEPLTDAEKSAVVLWAQSVFDTLRRGKTVLEHLDDPFGLKHTFQALLEEADRVGVNLDVLSTTNYLKRVSEGRECILFSDPFN